MRLSDISIRTKAYSFFIFLFVISTFNFALMIYLETQSQKDFYWVNHTHEVIDLSDVLLVNLVNAETGQRGYLLTAKSGYLDPHYSGIVNARKIIEKLKSKIDEAPEQQQRLARIEQLTIKKFEELQETIDLSRQGKQEEAMELVLSDLGKSLMQEIRIELAAFKEAEEALLQQRRSSFISVRNDVLNVFIAEVIVFSITLIILAFIISRTILTPLNTLYKAAKAFKTNGKFEPVAITNKDEIGLLAHALNTMGSNVVELLADLDKTAKQAVIERDIAIEQAISDPLTGLSNRRFMEVELEQLMQSSKRYGHKLSIIMFDIDHFKKVNDTFGHPVGDIVLQEIGAIVKQKLRGGDLAIRYGGEEFMMVLTHTSIEGAEIKAEALRQKLEETIFPQLNHTAVTISLGITQLKDSDQTITQMILRADEALYEAKNSGRNCWKSH